jgi:hypothetical protein
MAAQRIKSFSDIYTRIREELKIQSGDTTNIARIKRLVNETYEDAASLEQWDWMRGRITLVHETALETGTVSVTNGSVSATLSSAPTLSRTGYLFSVEGSNEIYRITSHTGGAAAITLDYPFLGETNSTASYQIWTDALPLPADAREAIKITHEHSSIPLEGVGLQKFRDIVIQNPKEDGRPRVYTLTDYVDATPYSAVGSIPSSVSRASAGLVKTLVFNTTVAALLEQGDRVKISGAGHYSYNGEFVISSVSTTTITYTGTVPYTESTTADTGWTLTLANAETGDERYRELLVHPAINTSDKTALKVEYIREPKPLEDDTDEPLMPLSDRVVLVYGALMTAWSSIMRSSEDAQRNAQLYQRKLAAMQGKLTATTDLPRLQVSRDYLAAKRTPSRRRFTDWDQD